VHFDNVEHFSGKMIIPVLGHHFLLVGRTAKYFFGKSAKIEDAFLCIDKYFILYLFYIVIFG